MVSVLKITCLEEISWRKHESMCFSICYYCVIHRSRCLWYTVFKPSFQTGCTRKNRWMETHLFDSVYVCHLGQGGYVFSPVWVALSVSRIMGKMPARFSWNLAELNFGSGYESQGGSANGGSSQSEKLNVSPHLHTTTLWKITEIQNKRINPAFTWNISESSCVASLGF